VPVLRGAAGDRGRTDEPLHLHWMCLADAVMLFGSNGYITGQTISVNSRWYMN